MGSHEKEIVRGCQKFQENYKYYSDSEKEAIIFLKLRKEGCPRKSALNFSAKSVCKSDSTRTVFGPPNFRLLKVSKLPNYTIQKGWFQGNLPYKMDKECYLSYKDIIHEDSQDDNLQNIFDKNEDLAKQEFKKMLKVMRQYFDDISSKFQLSRGNSNSDYLQNIKQLIEETRKNLKQRTYFEYKNVKFYHLSQLLKQILDSEKQSQEEIQGVIEKFNIFNNVLKQPDIKNIEIKQEDYSNDESFLQISPHSQSGKKKGWTSPKDNRNVKGKILNQSLNDSGISSTPRASPKVGSICASSEAGQMHDLTQEGSLSKQSSLGMLGYISSDSINSFGYQQSGEDKTISPECETPRSTYLAESTPRKQDISIIHSAALQLQVLQQMDQTNQDLFSVEKNSKSQRVQPLHGSVQSKRMLEQQFNEAQYFYSNESQKKKKEQEERKKKLENYQKNSQSKIASISTEDGEDQKKRKTIKMQNLLKVDSDVQEVFNSLTQSILNSQENKDEISKKLQKSSSQQYKNIDSQILPPSLSLQKESLFKRDFVGSSKNNEVNLKYKNGKKLILASSTANFTDTSRKIESSLQNNQNTVFDTENLNTLVDFKNQMMENFRRRNYRRVNRTSTQYNKPIFDFGKQQTPLQKVKTTINSSNLHLRNQTYSHKEEYSNPLKVQITNSTLASTKQSKLSYEKQQQDNQNSFENPYLSTSKMIQQKLLRLTTSIAKGIEDTPKRKSNVNRRFSYYDKPVATPINQYSNPVNSSRLLKSQRNQMIQTKSILKNLGQNRLLTQNNQIQFS